ncbi:Gag-Pol polyprotein [Plakobranchus ocellatus]|uniref:Gag-Pol polyprotein n=1 Tax=Plakobranchus ocellatus TaxID=259542 RepID=A0AAV4C0V9_9GAST|nr:Gag-Pol polyprotein [Plakobranchus ocellatus]
MAPLKDQKASHTSSSGVEGGLQTAIRTKRNLPISLSKITIGKKQKQKQNRRVRQLSQCYSREVSLQPEDCAKDPPDWILWMDELPGVLLGIRSTWKEDLDASPALLTYGTNIRHPGDFLTDKFQMKPSCSIFNTNISTPWLNAALHF